LAEKGLFRGRSMLDTKKKTRDDKERISVTMNESRREGLTYDS
jgi:hypothetical protein